MTLAAREGSGVVQVVAEVLANEPAGAYRHLVLAAPGLPPLAAPGQFVALAVGTPGEHTSAMLLRRSFSLHRADPADGTVEVVLAAHGAGTRELTVLRPGERVDVLGPLGRGFPLPSAAEPCVLVGGGYGSAPLLWLAERLRDGGCPVEVVLGAATADRLFGVAEAAQVTGGADAVHVTTDDGTAGTRGWVSDVLPRALERSGARTVYACGPMGMLRAVTEVAAGHDAVAHVAVEEAMACGIGICMTCVLPVVRDDGRTAMVRSCVDGPVLRGDRVRWDAIGDGRCDVPADAVGAPGTPPVVR